jgi:galactokinase
MSIGEPSDLTAGAVRALEEAGGSGARPAIAWAPGRCTLVGEHVDYAGGQVLCIGVDRGIAAAVRASPTGRYLAASAGAAVTRLDVGPVGDIGDRVFAPVVALRDRGLSVPAIEVGIAATLPAGAGLASSAALIIAVATAILRMLGETMTAEDLAAVALSAERDVVGVPCGPLDQRAVIDAPNGGALLLDCRSGGETAVPWPWAEVMLVGCDTGVQHDVGGIEYRRRREETESGLEALGVTSCQDLRAEAIASAALDRAVRRRLQHVMGETRRSVEAAEALRRGDVEMLGGLMSASHRSLRDLHEVSTPALDAVVGAALAVPGCAGARMVGAGFGGAVVALVTSAGAAACRTAMTAACGGGRTFELRPSPGLAVLAPDVVRG